MNVKWAHLFLTDQKCQRQIIRLWIKCKLIKKKYAYRQMGNNLVRRWTIIAGELLVYIFPLSKVKEINKKIIEYSVTNCETRYYVCYYLLGSIIQSWKFYQSIPTFISWLRWERFSTNFNIYSYTVQYIPYVDNVLN